jgi:diamine N-acetyltransferase
MLELRKIDWDNYDDVIKLTVDESQKGFCHSNEYSLAQAYVSSQNSAHPWMPFAIYNDDDLVGFAMICYDNDSDDEDFVCPHYYMLQLMVDKKHQGKGYGRAAMTKVLEFIKTHPQGPGAAVYLSYWAENDFARKFFQSFGFKETGKIYDDEGADEIVATLVL